MEHINSGWKAFHGNVKFWLCQEKYTKIEFGQEGNARKYPKNYSFSYKLMLNERGNFH